MRRCPACGSGNEERSAFCNDCGQRLPGEGGGPEGGGDHTGVADPATGSLRGTPLPAAPVAYTPVAPAKAPTQAGTCIHCSYPLPASGTVSWCPGCGALLDTPPRPSGAATVPSVGPSGPVPQGWKLVLLKAGERLDRYPLRRPVTTLGRTDADYVFPEDLLLSPRHAQVIARPPGFWVEDAGSRNGVFLRLREARALHTGDVLNLGSLVFRFEAVPTGPRSTEIHGGPGAVRPFGSGKDRAIAHLVRILRDGADGPAYPLTSARTVVGRKVGHYLFPDDPLLSRQHAQFHERDGKTWVEDLGSSNGTMVRIREVTALDRGAVVRIGDVTLEMEGP